MRFVIALLLGFMGLISVVVSKDIVIFAILMMIAAVICCIEENETH